MEVGKKKGREKKNLIALVQVEEVLTWTKLVAQRQVVESWTERQIPAPSLVTSLPFL